MPTLKNYRLLISHSWRYSNDYDTVVTWLNQTTNFRWANHSVSADNPMITKTKYELRRQLTEQIQGCHALIIISGMYASYSEWIDYEIDEAVRMNKPIIAIKPWGNERVPTKIQNYATTLIGWNSSSLITAIRFSAL